MKNRKSVLGMTFMQILKRPCCYFSVLAIIGVCFVTIKPYLSAGSQGVTASYLTELLISLSMAKKLIILCGSFACAAGFCTDWNSQYIKSIVIRSGIKKYTFSKVVVCFTITFLSVLIGMSIFSAALSFKYPILIDADIKQPFAALAEGRFPFLYLLAHIAVFAGASGAWVVVGLMVSSYIPNSFVAVIVPIVSSYIFEDLTSYLPPFMNLYAITRSVDVIGKGALLSFAYFTAVFLFIVIAAGLLFHYQVKRRIHNEVV